MVGSDKAGIHGLDTRMQGYKASGLGKGWMLETGCRTQDTRGNFRDSRRDSVYLTIKFKNKSKQYP